MDEYSSKLFKKQIDAATSNEDVVERKKGNQ
jgi:hypothetical protein